MPEVIATPPGFDPWEPGSPGKGLWFSNGKLMLWKTGYDPNVGDEANWATAPHHWDAFHALNIPYDGKRVQNELVLDAQGNVHGLSGAPHGIEKIDPRLTPVDDVDDPGGWHFGKVVEHQLEWQPGEHGRALVTEDGAVHTWMHAPNHAEYASRQGLKPRSFYFISPGGTLTPGARSFPHDHAVVDELIATSGRKLASPWIDGKWDPNAPEPPWNPQWDKSWGEGRGFVTEDGEPYVFSAHTTHGEAARRLGVKPRSWFWVGPGGGVTYDSNVGQGAQDVEMFAAHHPDLWVDHDEQAKWDGGWKFGAR